MIPQAVHAFALASEPENCVRYGNGHINDTYLLSTRSGKRYILQKINTRVFPDADALMSNIERVTGYLSKLDPDPNHVLTLVPTLQGASYYRDAAGGCWRVYHFVENSLCLNRPETDEDYAASGRAFGDFQRRLERFPADTLCEIIPRFHDTPHRFRQLDEAVQNNAAGRLNDVQDELNCAERLRIHAGALVDALAAGALPLRVTHNDTKLNNVLLDADTRQPLCVIDLDTVMPGLMAYDFGDSIRFGASTAPEDERDLSRVSFSMDLYRVYARAFLGACPSGMTRAERQSLPMGALLMTLECAIRFLADYLNGDVYFHTAYPGHNLVRARTQFKLAEDMERQMDAMTQFILDI